METWVNPERFLQKLSNPDAEYLKQSSIGQVVAKGLSVLYLNQPDNPLNFLGNWFLNQSKEQKDRDSIVQREENKKVLIHKFMQQEEERRQTEIARQIEDEKRLNWQQSFQENLEQSRDVEDQFGALIEHLQQYLNATGVYIGKLEGLKKPIGDLDDETAHIDSDAPNVVTYIAASQDHQFMILKQLHEEEGPATYEIWKPPEDSDEPTPQEDSEDENQESGQQVNLIQTSYVENVVFAEKMKFFDVPKLGCYFAVELTYQSCLDEKAFDLGLEDLLECNKLRAEQAEEMKKIQEQKDQESRDESKIIEDEEEKVFEEIKEGPFQKTKQKYVVCMDTLGQDREFNADEREYVINIIDKFRVEWERSEVEALQNDIKTHLAQHKQDKEYAFENLLQYLPVEDLSAFWNNKCWPADSDNPPEWFNDEKLEVERVLADMQDDKSDEEKALIKDKCLLEIVRNRVLDPVIKQQLNELKNFRVVKFGRFIQLVMYFLGIHKHRINEHGTNKFCWKKAKKYINTNFFTYLQVLSPFGPKRLVPQAYAMTKYLEQELEKINPEELQEYSLCLAILYTFIKLLITLRIQDVTNRRTDYLQRKEARELAIQQAKELKERRDEALENARQDHENSQDNADEGHDNVPFDAEAFLKEFDSQKDNEPIEIPPEVFPDEDGDLDWSETNPQISKMDQKKSVQKGKCNKEIFKYTKTHFGYKGKSKPCIDTLTQDLLKHGRYLRRNYQVKSSRDIQKGLPLGNKAVKKYEIPKQEVKKPKVLSDTSQLFKVPTHDYSNYLPGYQQELQNEGFKVQLDHKVPVPLNITINRSELQKFNQFMRKKTASKPKLSRLMGYSSKQLLQEVQNLKATNELTPKDFESYHRKTYSDVVKPYPPTDKSNFSIQSPKFRSCLLTSRIQDVSAELDNVLDQCSKFTNDSKSSREQIVNNTQVLIKSINNCKKEA